MSGASGSLETLLEHLQTNRGFDFRGYKPASLARRIDKRMKAVGVDGYGPYIDLLEVDPSEYEHLFNAILINVTCFFRDAEIWEYLRADVLPRLLAGRGPADSLRVWCAGCASGEEPYSMAMLFAEVLGLKQTLARVKIYATDIDQDALAVARQGVYTARQVESVPADLRRRYFEESPSGHLFDRQLRRIVIFGRHDLIQDAPISHIDILSCRNTLMYFNRETQAGIMSRFYFALNEDGVLVLGKAETTSGYGQTFTPLNMRRRVFVRGAKAAPGPPPSPAGPAAATDEAQARELAFEAGPAAQILVDAAGVLVGASSRARELFALEASDLGRPFRELELSWKPADLHGLLQAAQREGRPSQLKGVILQSRGEPVHLDIDVLPLNMDGKRPLGVAITYVDVSRERLLREELEQSGQELETAIEELHSTNQELETTNEELQSTNEELETTNEELQSTNEELETMNEELQSTNDELEATNSELRNRTGELNRLNRFMQTMMASVRTSVIVVDSSLRIQWWNRQSYELWGVRAEEVVGTPLPAVDIGLPHDRLAPALMACLGGGSASEEFEIEAMNRRGRPIRCRVAITPMDTDSAQVDGAIILIEQYSAGDGEPGPH